MTSRTTANPAAALADIHASAFDAPWTADAFADLLAQAGVWALAEDDGFVLMRIAADEAEVLTLAVRPAARRAGLARRLLARALDGAARGGARRVFLEVAADNVAAQALYAGAGFAEAGRRPRYYARLDGERVDALLLARDLASPLP